MATKIGKVVTYCDKFPPTKLSNHLNTWSRDKSKTFYLPYLNFWSHQS